MPHQFPVENSMTRRSFDNFGNKWLPATGRFEGFVDRSRLRPAFSVFVAIILPSVSATAHHGKGEWRKLTLQVSIQQILSPDRQVTMCAPGLKQGCEDGLWSIERIMLFNVPREVFLI
jgi:hypothetical protein